MKQRIRYLNERGQGCIEFIIIIAGVLLICSAIYTGHLA